MGATFLVTLREAFEAALLLGIVYTYLDKVGARAQFQWVTLGGVLGLVASLLMGVAVTIMSGPLLDIGPDLIGAAVIFLAVVLLTWHAWWMQQHARSLRSQLEDKLAAARSRQRLWIVGMIAFTGVFREGAETVLFLWGIMAQAATPAGWGSVFSGVAGVLVAGVIGYAIFHGGRNVSLRKFFLVTTALLLVLAAGLFASGVGRLQGFGLVPLSAPVWDTSWLVSDRSVVGGFLSGLIGYRSSPSLPEVVAYVGYLVVAGILVFGVPLTPTPAPARAPAARPRAEARRSRP